VVISYRLSPKDTHPTHVNDVAQSLRWVKDNIGSYGGDPEQVYVSGHSAGAHLVALVTLDTSYLKEVGLDRQFIKGAICMCGIYDIHLFARGGKQEWYSCLLGYLSKKMYIMPAFGIDSEIWKTASPITHVPSEPLDSEFPPFLLLNAQYDLGLKEQSRVLAAALRDAGIKVETEVIEGTRHGSLVGMGLKSNGPPKPVINRIMKFLQAEH